LPGIPIKTNAGLGFSKKREKTMVSNEKGKE
jgi:hypothetical protein